tara:strand:+ start:954 stop:1721 length:768 start_codon:yes stop_codon:yes gene_type:complete
MAINVNNVYQTVLLILNKEQRGYMTPDEFNKTATQVQLDIFEQYFDDLNQQLRVPQADYDYTDRQVNLDDQISTFKCLGECLFGVGYFNLPNQDELTGNTIIYNDVPVGNEFAFYRIGTLTYELGGNTLPVEIERLQRKDFYEIQKSEYTLPSVIFPVYLYENKQIRVLPSTIITNVKTTFIRKPLNVKWAFTQGSLGQYIYDASSASQNFELESNEQVNVILRILQYSGIIIRDPQIIQAASAEIQQNEVNKKS